MKVIQAIATKNDEGKPTFAMAESAPSDTIAIVLDTDHFKCYQVGDKVPEMKKSHA